MDFQRELDLHLTRRQLFGLTARGIGVAALSSLLGPQLLAAGLDQARDPKTGGLVGLPHFAPKAKRVIFLHQSGGPSQLETFDYKPGLAKYQGTQIPDSIRQGQRVAQTMGQSTLPVARSQFSFAQYGQAGTWVSELLPHTAKIVDDITVIKTMNTDAINHDPAITFIQTGFQQPGRPSMGAWLSYGLGSENQNLPVVRGAPVASARDQYGSTTVLTLVGERLPSVQLPGRPLPRRRRARAVSRGSPGREQGHAARDARRRGEARRDETSELRRSGNRYPYRAVRDGVPDADVACRS